MKIKLISDLYNDNSLLPIEVVLLNRGIKKENINHFLNTTDEDICDYKLLGENKLRMGAEVLLNTISNQEDATIIVDVDVDGYTSAAILINFLYKIFPKWTKKHLHFYMHDKKLHGLKDCIEEMIKNNSKLIICPDSASSDVEEQDRLLEAGKKFLCLDHHLSKNLREDIPIINNQIGDYPNKDLSGAGVTWQFCRYLDYLHNSNYADDFLDLVALGLIADVMNLTSIETQHLVRKGLSQIKNLFFLALVDKSNFFLGDELTAEGVAFYVAPLINALTRSGTKEEQELVFSAFIDYCAREELSSTKRGHKDGDIELHYEQAARVATNVKSRQTKFQEKGQILIEGKIEEKELLDNHSVLLILLQKGDIEGGLAGLIANKLMSKYQRPTCVLTECEDGCYVGSARGYIYDFKSICEQTQETVFQEGHEKAFGLSIEKDKIESFLNKTDELLKDIDSEIVYNCDFSFDMSIENTIDVDLILGIGKYKRLWGEGIKKPLLYFSNLSIDNDKVKLLKSDTVKIDYKNISIISFKNKELYDILSTLPSYKTINIVAEADINKWQGEEFPQLKLVDYEVNQNVKEYIF